MSRLSEILREDARYHERRLANAPENYQPKGYAKQALERAEAERQAERDAISRSSITGY